MYNAGRVGFSTVSKVVVEVCDAIIAEFEYEVLKTPANADGWKEVAHQLEQ